MYVISERNLALSDLEQLRSSAKRIASGKTLLILIVKLLFFSTLYFANLLCRWNLELKHWLLEQRISYLCLVLYFECE